MRGHALRSGSRYTRIQLAAAQLRLASESMPAVRWQRLCLDAVQDDFWCSLWSSIPLYSLLEEEDLASASRV
ncbi:MAG: hypothetical protein ACLVJH_00890 [Faecalibacterium prausnitzii]